MGCAAHVGRKGHACRVLVVTPEGKRPLVRPRYRQESNVEIHVEEIELESEDLWAQIRGLMLGSCESSNEPIGSINVGSLKYLSSIGFSKTTLSKLTYLVVVYHIKLVTVYFVHISASPSSSHNTALSTVRKHANMECINVLAGTHNHQLISGTGTTLI